MDVRPHGRTRTAGFALSGPWPWRPTALGQVNRHPQASVSYPQRGDKEAPASGTAWMSSPSCAAAPHPGQVLTQFLSRTACSLAGDTTPAAEGRPSLSSPALTVWPPSCSCGPGLGRGGLPGLRARRDDLPKRGPYRDPGRPGAWPALVPGPARGLRPGRLCADKPH